MYKYECLSINLVHFLLIPSESCSFSHIDLVHILLDLYLSTVQTCAVQTSAYSRPQNPKRLRRPGGRETQLPSSPSRLLAGPLPPQHEGDYITQKALRGAAVR